MTRRKHGGFCRLVGVRPKAQDRKPRLAFQHKRRSWQHTLGGGRGPTCGQVHDVDQHVSALHHVHHHVGEAAVVLQEGGRRGDRLHHLMHQDELLGVLQVPLGQVHVQALVHGAALQGKTSVLWEVATATLISRGPLAGGPLGK